MGQIWLHVPFTDKEDFPERFKAQKGFDTREILYCWNERDPVEGLDGEFQTLREAPYWQQKEMGTTVLQPQGTESRKPPGIWSVFFPKTTV